jgi:hypothetical protein
VERDKIVVLRKKAFYGAGHPGVALQRFEGNIRVVQKLQFLNNNRLKTARNVNFVRNSRFLGDLFNNQLNPPVIVYNSYFKFLLRVPSRLRGKFYKHAFSLNKPLTQKNASPYQLKAKTAFSW